MDRRLRELQRQIHSGDYDNLGPYLSILKNLIVGGDHSYLKEYRGLIHKVGKSCWCENLECAAAGHGSHVYPESYGGYSPQKAKELRAQCKVRGYHEPSTRYAGDCTCPPDYMVHPGVCVNMAGDASLAYVGDVCDDCAIHTPMEHHLDDCGCPACDKPESLPEVHGEECECDQCLIAGRLTDDPDLHVDPFDENDPMLRDIDEFPEQGDFDDWEDPDRINVKDIPDWRTYHGDEEYWEEESQEDEWDDDEDEDDHGGWMG